MAGVEDAMQRLQPYLPSCNAEIEHYELLEEIECILRQEEYQNDPKILVDAAVQGIESEKGIVFLTADDSITTAHRKRQLEETIQKTFKKDALTILDIKYARLET